MLDPREPSIAEMGDLAALVPLPNPELRPLGEAGPAPPGAAGQTIPICEPAIGERESVYVLEALNSNWISSQGRFVRDFEAQFAQAAGVRYGVACANGTAALHLILAALDLQPDDEVILPTFTMIATLNAVTYTGATPVLVDSELTTWNMDPEQVRAKLTPRTRAIVGVHTYGHPLDVDPVRALADERGIPFIEDAAEAHGATYRDRRIGSLGLGAAFSFYANKIITTGDGGMVTTDSEPLANLVRTLRDHGISDDRHFWHRYVGFNYRMSSLQAAFGIAQTERLAESVEIRRAHAALYTRHLVGIPGITPPPEACWARNTYWLYAVLLDAKAYGRNRADLREYLARCGIETRPFFVPMHVQPVYWDQFKGQRYPAAELLAERGLLLPSSQKLTTAEIEYICQVIADGCAA
jgi:perosamine synthetase